MRCCWATRPHAPAKRESITCEPQPRRAPEPTARPAGVVAADGDGQRSTSPHSGRMGGAQGRPAHRAGFRDFLADGVWRRVRLAATAAGARGADIVAPLDSPRLTRLLGQLRRRGPSLQGRRRAGPPHRPHCASQPIAPPIWRRPPATGGWSTSRCTRSSPSAACSAALADLFSLRGERPRSRCSPWWPAAGPTSSPRAVGIAVARLGARRSSAVRRDS